MDPHGAVAAHNDLGSLYSIGMHYETFRLTPLGYNEAATEFQVAHRSIWNPQTKFELIKPGTTVRIPLKQLCAVEKPKLINP